MTEAKTDKAIRIIGGGLAGTEATWQAINMGVPVILHEMRPVRKTDAHLTEGLAELVCSNSFRSDDAENNAVGLLHAEMRLLNSLVMAKGEIARVPAGSAMAVDRDVFSDEITKTLEQHPLVTIDRTEVTELPDGNDGPVIIATGPLTSSALAESIVAATGEDRLAFFDAIAPIVFKDSIDFTKAWYQSRYDKGDSADYINLPLSKEQYETFVQALLDGDKTDFKEWEKDTPYFEGCMPIEIMASRGPETLRYGPMKPVGLTNPHSEEQPYAVVQLRQDNKLGTLYNIVGFQTKLKYGAQKDIFSTLPGLENARYARLGGLHRNTFINSPLVLDNRLRLKAQPHIRFAGQVTGVEGYVESAAIGLIAGRLAAYEALGEDMALPPETTAHGALIAHITGGADAKTFQPMNVNFGLFPPPAGRVKRRERKPAQSARALKDLKIWIDNLGGAKTAAE